MTFNEAIVLFPICEKFEASGTTPEDSLMRPIARELFGRDTAMTLTMVGREVYRLLAIEFVRRLSARTGLESYINSRV